MKATFDIEQPTTRDLFYYRAKLQGNIYHDVLERFAELARDHGFTKKKLAAAINKDAAQVTRLFAEPGNWTLATVSDLLLAMGAELEHRAVPIRPQSVNHIERATVPSTVVFDNASGSNWSAPPRTYSNVQYVQ